jgi:RNA polymerase sigma-70 factor (ECF subfamily)
MMNQFSDQDLVEKLKTDNETAFDYLFLAYYEKLCIYAYTVLKNKDTAEEIVQDVFVKLWEHHTELSIETSIKAYLFRTVHNQCINYFDHLKVQQKYSEESIRDNHEIVSPVSPDYPVANLLVQDLENRINQSIAQLPGQCQEVFLLVRYEDFSYNQVAEKLGISVNTVKTQLKRAMSRLREEFKDYFPLLIIIFCSL